MTLRTAVVVCAHNEESHLAGGLHSLLAQTRLPDEILVIDNASTDRTAAIARETRRAGRRRSTSISPTCGRRRSGR